MENVRNLDNENCQDLLRTSVNPVPHIAVHDLDISNVTCSNVSHDNSSLLSSSEALNTTSNACAYQNNLKGYVHTDDSKCNLLDDLALSSSDSDEEEHDDDAGGDITGPASVNPSMLLTSGYCSGNDDEDDNVPQRRRRRPCLRANLRHGDLSPEKHKGSRPRKREYSSGAANEHKNHRMKKTRKSFHSFKPKQKSASPYSQSVKRKLCSEDAETRHDKRTKRRRRQRYTRFERESAPSPESSDSDEDEDTELRKYVDDSTSSSSDSSDTDSSSSESNQSSDSELDSSPNASPGFSSSGSDSSSDDDDGEIDLRYRLNPCPFTCVCRSWANMSHVTDKIPRHDLYRTVEPLYNRVLKSRMLRNRNLFLNKCCGNDCCKDWVYDRPSARLLYKDYRDSDLNVTRYKWGEWKANGD